MKNTISRKPLRQLGRSTNSQEDIWNMRTAQQNRARKYRNLTSTETSILLQNRNYCEDWSQVWVTDSFLPEMIRDSRFYGLVRIGEMQPEYLEYRDLCLPTGIYNSMIISSDIGDYNAVHQVGYMAHFVLGDEVILFNVHEMETSPNAKFGFGVIKNGENPNQLIEIELRNENGKRGVLPFESMLAGDAYLWSQYAADPVLKKRFEEMTSRECSLEAGQYSRIGDGCVVKNSHIIKDVRIGPSAYIKGVNKLKNVTIRSSKNAITQIGEGCELVNGFIGEGCRIFYGVKAVRFFLADFSQLKYGARLINSYLSENSTISCCEVLNSLLFPSHEQHHNNSFLCASFIKGQSNLAAGATVGSNHNSRAADGELVAGRGFWPGLCVSLKHPSRFASYNLIVKGDFHFELDIPIPFSLISHDIRRDCLVLIPGYWFIYNMYALMRNQFKFAQRDKRIDRSLKFETDILAPDTILEMLNALDLFAEIIGREASQNFGKQEETVDFKTLGHQLLSREAEPWMDEEINVRGLENSNRPVYLKKIHKTYQIFHRLIRYYVANEIMITLKNGSSQTVIIDQLNKVSIAIIQPFENLGGPLVPRSEVEIVLNKIKSGEMLRWSEVHTQYLSWSQNYPAYKLENALLAWKSLPNTSLDLNILADIQTLVKESIETKKWICEEIKRSRKKDFQNPFRKMMYENEQEMTNILGKMENDTFIKYQEKEFAEYKKDFSLLFEPA